MSSRRHPGAAGPSRARPRGARPSSGRTGRRTRCRRRAVARSITVALMPPGIVAASWSCSPSPMPRWSSHCAIESSSACWACAIRSANDAQLLVGRAVAGERRPASTAWAWWAIIDCTNSTSASDTGSEVGDRRRGRPVRTARPHERRRRIRPAPPCTPRAAAPRPRPHAPRIHPPITAALRVLRPASSVPNAGSAAFAASICRLTLPRFGFCSCIWSARRGGGG